MKKVTIKECIEFFEILHPKTRVEIESTLKEADCHMYYEVIFHIGMEDVCSHSAELEDIGEDQKV